MIFFGYFVRKWIMVEYQAVFLESNKEGTVQDGLYFCRRDRGVPFDRESCTFSLFGIQDFPDLDRFNEALVYATHWAVPEKEIVEPPPMPSNRRDIVVVWTKNCSEMPCVFGVSREEAKDVMFSLASTRTSLVE